MASKSKKGKAAEQFQYWAQQPITWGLVLGGSFLLWQLVETLSLNSQVNKNTDRLKAIEDSGEASDINVERRLQSLQSKTSAIDEDRESLEALQRADAELEGRLTATENTFEQIDELHAADQAFSNQIETLQSRIDVQAEQLAKADENIAKVRELQSNLDDALRRVGEAEDRFDAVQEVYQSLSDAQQYITELRQSRDALAAIEATSANIVYKDELAQKNDEILKVVRELFAQQSAASALLNPEVSSLRGTALWEPLTKITAAVGVYTTLIQEGADSGTEWDAAWKQLGTAITQYSDQAEIRLQQVANVESESLRIKRLLKITGKGIITSILGSNSSKAIKDFNDEVDRRWLKQVGDSPAPSTAHWGVTSAVVGILAFTGIVVGAGYLFLKWGDKTFLEKPNKF